MLEIGDDAPDFELPDQRGDLVSLSDFRGEHVVVYFYPRADTPGCTTEACGFRDSWDEFEDRDAAVIGISDDPVSDLDSFAEKYDLPFTLLSDEDGSVSAAYDSYGEKNMFGKTFDGVFRNSYLVGPDGTVERVYEGVSPDGHADEILADLDELDG
ncbi:MULTISPECIES: thioredoxin-dependent thiol peroxidase [Haloferax]|uniref:thioredoxin-dependent peroxiredoxin n=1 Tax=Haloferax massiliensis TaxID=1476858 RepID=A0A0D6JPG6_9EURY|nr:MULTISPECIES: thioredoxin-dependent thiol peroxidase [Haloferax]MDS0241118.1 thioredoxin-dependent thiol peroxidase [Haloferax sp. S2CR25]MDS0444239.1 thioredoxin-dependent thiol peroxidase [Haloferax sp. S2CR25-2]CQR49503.1 Putative peroxiredoxin bcp [Haloferax massiliensis]